MDLGLVKDGPFKVRLFLGPRQSKVPVSLAAALQPLGDNAGYVALEAAGANALDFHIAYYLGVLSSEDPSAFFHVISKDTGFDPLIKHLIGKGVRIQRSECIADMPCFKPAVPDDQDERLEIVIEDLRRRKAAKPRTPKTLLATIHARLNKELSKEEVASLTATLCERGWVQVEGTKISYSLPGESEARGVSESPAPTAKATS